MRTQPPFYDCLVIGGGIHGTYIARELTQRDSGTRIGIVDPNPRLLDSFRTKARACGMTALRSSFVNHLGGEPFQLEHFANGENREDELVPTVDYPERPTLSLFLDHAEHVIKRSGLSEKHIQATVKGIHPRQDGGLTVETTVGDLQAATCVLAIGYGGRYTYPEWTTTLPADAPVFHVWEDENGILPETDTDSDDDATDEHATDDHTIVVGGGITAVQLACALATDHLVTLLTRHPLSWETAEADPPWLNWSHIESKIHCHPPGSAKRLAVVNEARYDASVPPALYELLREHIDQDRLEIEQGTVASARASSKGADENEPPLTLTLERGRTLHAERAVLATGFERIFDHPFVDQLKTDLRLAHGAEGMPVLTDETLAWQYEDGSDSQLFVSGALALGTVGPYAPNIPGARRASERICDAITQIVPSHAVDRPAVSVPK